MERSGDKRRKAYLSLWTEFVMQGNQIECAPTLEPAEFQPLSRAEVAVYMISPAGKGGVILSAEAAAAYQAIVRGVSEAAVNKLLTGLIWEEGELLLTPDHDTRRRYFQIGDNVQFWLELQRDASQWLVACKSPLEPKTVWHRYPSHQISLPLE